MANLRQINTIPKLVHWFYEEYIGRTPDRTVYAKYQRILKPLVKESKRGPKVRVYTVQDLVTAILVLDELGVPLDRTGLEVLLYPDLVAEVLDGNPNDYVRWIKSKFSEDGKRRENISGW